MYFKKLIEIRIKRVGQWINVILTLLTGREVKITCTLCTLMRGKKNYSPQTLIEWGLQDKMREKCKICENKFDYSSISAKFILTSERNRSQPTLHYEINHNHDRLPR